MATSSLRHNSQNEWRASVAFYNLGLAGNAFDGKNWKQHKRVLLPLFTDLLKQNKNTLGLFLNEVGNWSDFLSVEGKKRLELVLTDAFESAGATQHGPPKFFWSNDETMAALRHDVDVIHLKPLKDMQNFLEISRNEI